MTTVNPTMEGQHGTSEKISTSNQETTQRHNEFTTKGDQV